MRTRPSEFLFFALAWLVLTACGAMLLAQRELARGREEFEVQARIAHRLLSQRAAQHESVLATLALLQPAEGDAAVKRLSSIHPQILSVRRRAGMAMWDTPAFAAAEVRSREGNQPALASTDLSVGRAWLVLAGTPASFAMQIDLTAALQMSEPSGAAGTRPELLLRHGGEQLLLQPAALSGGWTSFEAHKRLASGSQPFELVARRPVNWSELPWPAMAAWSLACAAVLLLAFAWKRQRVERRRAEELLRVGQVSRLNTLGELGAGLAHELNQPLAAILADSQAAVRLLSDEEPEVAPARAAMQHAAQQARRASDVVQRLRRLIEKPRQPQSVADVALQISAREALQLLEPELASRRIKARMEGGDEVRVHAERVAVEQVLHNLLLNAVQALELVPEGERELIVHVAREQRMGVLRVEDSGPGVAAEHRQRVFEPFFTTRARGLGLGLSLCQSLAEGMGGDLRLRPATGRGACFELRLPLAAP